MTTPHDPLGDDHDHTGVRDLLSALPDPGPMPEAVATRILASLSQARSPESSPASPAPAAPAVSDLSAHRSRRRPRYLLAAAAAVAGLALVGGVVTEQLRQGDGADSMAALDPSRAVEPEESDGGAAGAASADHGQADEAQADEAQTKAPPVLAGSVTVLGTVPDLTRATMAAGALDAVTQSPPQLLAADPEADLSTAALAGCVEATGNDVVDASWWAGTARFDGAQAVLVVQRSGSSGDPLTAWALSAQCLAADGSAQVLAGPVDLP